MTPTRLFTLQPISNSENNPLILDFVDTGLRLSESPSGFVTGTAFLRVRSGRLTIKKNMRAFFSHGRIAQVMRGLPLNLIHRHGDLLYFMANQERADTLMILETSSCVGENCIKTSPSGNFGMEQSITRQKFKTKLTKIEQWDVVRTPEANWVDWKIFPRQWTKMLNERKPNCVQTPNDHLPLKCVNNDGCRSKRNDKYSMQYWLYGAAPSIRSKRSFQTVYY